MTFDQQNVAQHLKCRVNRLTFRDYTMANINAASKTCTLLIDAGHQGEGSAWVRTVKKNDEISYLKVEQHRYPSMERGNYLFLGDESAIGHFLTLQQMAANNQNIAVAVIIRSEGNTEQLRHYHPDLLLQSILFQNSYESTMINWLQQQTLSGYDGICIAGNISMVIEARQYLKKHGVAGNKIKAQGFWK